MSAFTAEERIALLLAILGEEVAHSAIAGMNPTRANFVQRLIRDYQENPPSDEEAAFIINDFVSYFQFALSARAAVEEQEAADKQEKGGSGRSGARRKDTEAVTYFPEVQATDDPVEDINKLDPFQVAEALSHDHPKTIALVLERLQPERSAFVSARNPTCLN